MRKDDFTHLIRSDAEYEQVVAEIERLLDAHPKEGSPADERIEFLSLLVEDYDRKHFELPGPEASPQNIVEFMLDVHGFGKAQLAETMGGRSRVSEFLSGKRALSIWQVYALRQLLKVPADLLIGDAPGTEVSPKEVMRVREADVHVLPSTAAGKYVVALKGKVVTKPTTRHDAISRASVLAQRSKTNIAIHSASGQITTRHAGKSSKPSTRRRG